LARSLKGICIAMSLMRRILPVALDSGEAYD